MNDAAGAKGVCALTGAHGYVGSVLRRTLQSAGWGVVVLSRTADAGAGEIPWSLDGRAAAEGGASSGSADESTALGPSVEAALRSSGASALVHAAWDMRLVKARDLERVNVQGSVRLLAQARAANLRRVVFISSISAFEGVRPLYGRTKLAVERAAAASGGIIVRPGMVYGKAPGGMFAVLRKQVCRPVTPLIGDGSYPQYLVHEDDLAAAVVNALERPDPPRVAVTVAHPRPWPLRELLAQLAAAQGVRPRFLPIPWPALYGGLRLAEMTGVKMGFRSDSIYSLVRQNPHPVMNAALLGVEPRPFSANP